MLVRQTTGRGQTCPRGDTPLLARVIVVGTDVILVCRAKRDRALGVARKGGA